MTLDTFFDILKNQATTAEERDQLDANKQAIKENAARAAQPVELPKFNFPKITSNPFKKEDQ